MKIDSPVLRSRSVAIESRKNRATTGITHGEGKNRALFDIIGTIENPGPQQSNNNSPKQCIHVYLILSFVFSTAFFYG